MDGNAWKLIIPAKSKHNYVHHHVHSGKCNWVFYVSNSLIPGIKKLDGCTQWMCSSDYPTVSPSRIQTPNFSKKLTTDKHWKFQILFWVLLPKFISDKKLSQKFQKSFKFPSSFLFFSKVFSCITSHECSWCFVLYCLN